MASGSRNNSGEREFFIYCCHHRTWERRMWRFSHIFVKTELYVWSSISYPSLCFCFYLLIYQLSNAKNQTTFIIIFVYCTLCHHTNICSINILFGPHFLKTLSVLLNCIYRRPGPGGHYTIVELSKGIREISQCLLLNLKIDNCLTALEIFAKAKAKPNYPFIGY